MQLQADLLQLPVLPSSAPEVSARGAAFAAGLACGLWQDQTELSRLADEDAGEFIGPRSTGASRAEHVKRWKHAVAQARLPER
jgi:glycerol kinase